MKHFNLPSSIVPATATLLAVLLFLYHLLRKPRRAYNSQRNPPEAGGGWPILGHLPLLGGSQPPHITLGDMADKYGPIFTIRMGVHRSLIVSNWEMAKECFTTNDKVFANRPKGAASELMAYNCAMFGFSPDGPYWRQVRKIATLELLSNQRLQMLGHVRESEVKTAIKEIYELWNAKKNRLELEMKKWFGDISLNTMFRIVVGKRYVNAVARSSNSGANEDRYLRAIRDFFELTGTFVLSDAIPYLRWLDLGGYEKAMKKTAKELDQVLQEWLEEHKRKGSSGSGEGDEQDFMGVMLSVLDEEISGYGVDTINKATCLVSG